MTTVTVGEESDTGSATIEGLVVETVTAAAHAEATAETAIEQAAEATGDVDALENEVRRIEQWQTDLSNQVGTISDQTAHLTQGFQAMSETMAKMMEVLQAQTALLTPANMSAPGVDGTPGSVVAPSASSSETPQAPEADAPKNPEADRAVARQEQKQATAWL